MVSTNSYINVLKHQYMILYFCSDRRGFWNQRRRWCKGCKKGQEANEPNGYNLLPLRQSPKRIYCFPCRLSKAKQSHLCIYCAMWSWTLYFTFYEECLSPGRLVVKMKQSSKQELLCYSAGHSTQLELNNCSSSAFCLLWHVTLHHTLTFMMIWF